MNSGRSRLEEEIESWKGFLWALRKEDRELWDVMIQVVGQFSEAVEASGKHFTTDPFFMALLLGQQKTIRRLQVELGALGVEIPAHEVVTMTTLDVQQHGLLAEASSTPRTGNQCRIDHP